MLRQFGIDLSLIELFVVPGGHCLNGASILVYARLLAFEIDAFAGDTLAEAAATDADAWSRFVIVAIVILCLDVRGCGPLVLWSGAIAGWFADWLTGGKDVFVVFVIELLNVLITVIGKALNVFVAVLTE